MAPAICFVLLRAIIPGKTRRARAGVLQSFPERVKAPAIERLRGECALPIGVARHAKAR
jgi:hypothetical protein